MSRTRLLALALLLGAGTLAYAAVRPTLFPQEEMPQPTEEHKLLMMGVGDWEGTFKMWQAPDAPAQETTAKETVTALGGFWTQSKFTFQMTGMDFAGSATMGYDPAKKKYVGTWIDVTNPTLTVMEGEVDPKTKMLVMRWVGPDMSGAVVPHRFESTFGADSYKTTFFAGEGNGVKTMEIAMKRVAKKAGPTGVAK